MWSFRWTHDRVGLRQSERVNRHEYSGIITAEGGERRLARPLLFTHHLREMVQGSGFRVQVAGCRVQGSGFRVQGSGCKVQGSGFRAWGLGCGVQGMGFRVQGYRLQV